MTYFDTLDLVAQLWAWGLLLSRPPSKYSEHWQRMGGKGRRFGGLMMQPVANSLTCKHPYAIRKGLKVALC